MSTPGHLLLCSMLQDTMRLPGRWIGLVKGIKCIQYYNKIIIEGWSRGASNFMPLPHGYKSG